MAAILKLTVVDSA